VAAVATLAAITAVGVSGQPASAAAGSAVPAAPSAGAASSASLNAAEAAAQARRSGKAVPATASTTATSTLTANPDGSFTLTQAPFPVRKKVGGAWVGLDATLVRQTDGSLVTKTTAQPLTLSGGGRGPLARLTSAGRSLALTAPVNLPTPTVSGPTATYASVLPGVDLQVTADAQGGFSSVLVVKNAAAAADPALASWTFATTAPGLTVTADAAGNLTATDEHKHPLFTAPAPIMWDSATTAPAASTPASGATTATGRTAAAATPATGAGATVKDLRTGRLLDRATGQPLTSDADGPGVAAHRAKLGVRADAAGVHLAPDAGLLKSAVFPAYIDPTWATTGPVMSGWATISKTYPSTNYWKTTPDPQGYMQVGNGSTILSRTLINFPVPAVLAGATINSAALSITENYAWSCTASVVNVYAPATTLTSANATWNAWSGVNLGSAVASANVAHGYNSSCPPAGVGFEVKAGVSAAVAAGRKTQTFALVAGNEASTYSWKEFLASSPTLSIQYNHAPTVTGLTTSPTTPCPSTTPGGVGDADVMLNAAVSDPDGTANGSLTTTITLLKGTTTVLSKSLSVPSGQTGRLVVPQATLEGQAGGTVTTFSWKATVSDGIATATSATCSFRFDPARPGRPTIADVPADGSTAAGQPVTVHINPPTTGGTPGSYLYQLNNAAPGTVPADSATGVGTLTITPSRLVNTLSVTAVSSLGNIGTDADTATIISTAPATVTPGDLTGDKAPDLVTVGSANGLPAGIWQAQGRNNGQVSPNAVNIGAYGNGTLINNSPTDFNAAQILVGHFTDTGVQDVLAYYPTGYTNGTNPGGGIILRGNGDGSALQPIGAIQIDGGFMTDNYGLHPTQLTDAGTALNQGQAAYDDLIGIAGDTANGYYLDYYPGALTGGGYGAVLTVTNKTPTGGTDWNNWKIAGTQIAGKTALFLFNPTTGALYLWNNLTTTDNQDFTATLTYTQHTLKTSGWNTGATLTLQAADINSDSTPDLWTTGAGRTTTAHLVTGLTGTPTLTAQPAQALTTVTHSWALADASQAVIGQPVNATNPARDAVGNLNLTSTGTTNTLWNSGDAFSPDVKLDGSTALTTGAALSTTSSFTVSAWVKPSAKGGIVLSQDGTYTSGFMLYLDPSTGWTFAVAKADAASGWSYDYIYSGSASLNVWTNVTASYNSGTGMMKLYVNNVMVASAVHTARIPATGNFQVGRYYNASKYSSYYQGQIAQVQIWGQELNPTQDSSPAGYYHPVTQTRLLDTRDVNVGGVAGPVAAGSTVKLQAAGARGVIPASNVSAVAVNITAVAPSTIGYFAVYPDNTPRPLSSNLNFVANQVVANFVIVPVGNNGKIDIYVSNASSHILVDVSGYFTTDAAATGNNTYTPLATPTRFLDTRNGTGAAATPLAGAGTLALQVGGTRGIPAGITAVAMNFTVVNASTQSFLITYPDGAARPGVSGLQYNPAGPLATMAIVPVNTTNGKIDIYNAGVKAINVIGDVLGYFTTGTSGQMYHPIGYARMVDTRLSGGALTNGQILHVAQGGVVSAVRPTLILNVTVTQPTSAGLFIVYTDSPTPPGTSNLNFNSGQTIANMALPVVGTNGNVAVYNNSTSAHAVVDCLGYFSG
jgi:hypothetical protein